MKKNLEKQKKDFDKVKKIQLDGGVEQISERKNVFLKIGFILLYFTSA